MEHLRFEFSGREAAPSPRRYVLVGVVGSGNLEVLIETAPLGGVCEAVVTTSIEGYGELWKRVLEDFFARQPLADVRVSINDGGANPAVVSLRLDQAAAEFLGGAA